jgi:NTP pyrophosphatase (non-canonical NTP hydrolase)
MDKTNLKTIINRSLELRQRYHELERKNHGSEWTVEEDALAFLTDAALVGRLAMAQQERWPMRGSPHDDLEHKLAESVWWLIVLAQRMDIDLPNAMEKFLSKTESLFIDKPL